VELEEGIQVVITIPGRHDEVYKDKMDKTIGKLLKLGHIHPSPSSFACPIVVVKKKGAKKVLGQ
jgi:hypothetical protein